MQVCTPKLDIPPVTTDVNTINKYYMHVPAVSRPFYQTKTLAMLKRVFIRRKTSG